MIIIVPAHNEEKIIGKTIESLLNQTVKPSKIIICLDNCTDRTKEISKEYNVEIYETINNNHKKAGALNQVFEEYKFNHEYIMIMDADTMLDNKVIEEGIKFLQEHKQHGVVCSRAGIIKPDKMNLKERFLWQLQHIEYGQFDSERIETKGNIKVSHRMCSIYRYEALNQIIKERKEIYLTDCLTEDYELTLMLKKYNWKISTNLNMKAWTDVPLNIKELWEQRVRWLKGGIDSLFLHGFKKHTRLDILSHYLFILIFSMQIGAIISGLILDNLSLNRLIIIIIGLSLLDNLIRLKYVQQRTRYDIIYIVTLIPIILYSWFNISTLLYSYYLKLFNKNKEW